MRSALPRSELPLPELSLEAVPPAPSRAARRASSRSWTSVVPVSAVPSSPERVRSRLQVVRRGAPSSVSQSRVQR